MKSFNITESPLKEFIDVELNKFGLDTRIFRNNQPPQEDFLLVSKKYPIFVVADGVTLIQYIIDKKEYPDPSPAGDVARIFCEKLLESAEARYDRFKENDIKEIFREANNAVGEYNRRKGRTKETTDYWDNDLYATTASFAVIKENKVYWGSICDSYVMVFSGDGKIKFQSPNFDERKEDDPPKFIGDSHDSKAKAQYTWRESRNGVNENQKLVGYGVATGEETANRYLNFGCFDVKQGDIVAILTDGFENYVQIPEFMSIFIKWSDDIESCFKKFTAMKGKENPEKFGHERTLIVVPI